ncbi:reverse transcriptase domain-containing protein [Tanacetum coccineum]
MFNSTLTGNARVWFDDLPKETIDSYDDLKKAFLENYLQQKKCIKDLVEIHNIRQRDGESMEEFVRSKKFITMDSVNKQAMGNSRLEDLPQEVLVKVLCGVEHRDCKSLFYVSHKIREVAILAKEYHFDYTTPRSFHSSLEFQAPKKSIGALLTVGLAVLTLKCLIPNNMCTAILKEAYFDETAIEAHPLTEVKKKYILLVKESKVILKKGNSKMELDGGDTHDGRSLKSVYKLPSCLQSDKKEVKLICAIKVRVSDLF